MRLLGIPLATHITVGLDGCRERERGMDEGGEEGVKFNTIHNNIVQCDTTH